MRYQKHRHWQLNSMGCACCALQAAASCGFVLQGSVWCHEDMGDRYKRHLASHCRSLGHVLEGGVVAHGHQVLHAGLDRLQRQLCALAGRARRLGRRLLGLRMNPEALFTGLECASSAGQHGSLQQSVRMVWLDQRWLP